ncbi:MAG TPA: Gfo/Idh/MocA family oxidoreductase [Chloroflexota bacterium]
MRVAMLGVGRIGAYHAANLQHNPEVSELRIFDVDLDRAAIVAHELEATVAPTVEATLEDAEAAVIATPSATHAELIRLCLARGIPAFSEKPLALDIAETERVAGEVAAKQGVLQIGFQRRFDPAYRAAREAIAAGKLGRVYSFAMFSRDRLPPAEAYISTSGGIFRDLHIHDFDITRWLFGQEVVEVFALGSTAGFPEYEQYGDAATTAISLRLAGGTLGVLTGARHNEAGYDIRVEVFGANDSIAIGLGPRTPTRSLEGDGLVFGGPPYPDFQTRFAIAYPEELRHFLRLARGEAKNPCTATDALQALRIAEAAHASMSAGRPVTVAS